MMMSEFAPNMKRSSEGWVEFPSDQKIRKGLWPENYTDHPAKYNCHLVWEVMRYLTNPEDTILDPMSGTGTTMLVALEGRKVICIELVEKYHMMQQHVLKVLENSSPGISENIMLLHGDCNKFLPIPADCIIFSPPYSSILHNVGSMTGSNASEKQKQKIINSVLDYNDPFNIGNTNDFIYWQRMEKIYTKLAQSAPLMAVVVKDGMKNKERNPIVNNTVDLCESVGWKLVENIKIVARGSQFLAFHKAHGEEVVEDESILILRRC